MEMSSDRIEGERESKELKVKFKLHMKDVVRADDAICIVGFWNGVDRMWDLRNLFIDRYE